MIVCLCHRISDRDIARLVAAGCGDLRSLQAALGLGSCCGSCLDYAQEMLDAHSPAGRPHSASSVALSA
jgi:bacterioferritin-associated ferredoxin